MGNGVIPLRAKNHPHRRILPLMNPMLFSVVEIDVHLPGVGMSEAAQFQVDHDEAAELAVEKEQVDTIPLVANSQPTLTGNEGEVPAQL